MDVIVKMSVITKIYSIIKEKKSSVFKIESVNEDLSTGLLVFLVKIEGKNPSVFKKDPRLLLSDCRSKNSFSDDDFNWIVDTVLENHKRIIEEKHHKKHYLLTHQYSDQLRESLIVYRDIENKIHMKRAKEIYSNIENIRNFSSEDSACIGNMVGYCDGEKDYISLQRKKRKNNKKTDVSKLSS